VTQLHTHSADSEGAEPVGQPVTYAPDEERGPAGPIELVMSTVIRKLAWSKLSNPTVAVTISGVGLLLGMLVGATAPNTETLPIKIGLSRFFPSLAHDSAIAMALLYTGTILACLGLAGMLWAHSQGWRPDPRRLLLASAGVVAVMVSLTPVGSSDVASYAAYGRISVLGGNPYTTNPAAWLGANSPYTHAVGYVWRGQSSVYGPIATVMQAFAAWLGGPSVGNTIWLLMIFNGAAFIGLGYLLLKTSDDPVRATLFWVANPVLLLALVAGGQIDTFVALAAICSIQVARKFSGPWGDVAVGVLIGLGCGIKVNAVLIGLGLAWPLLRRREWMRTARMAGVALATVAFEYSFAGLNALKPVVGGTRWVNMPSPWRLFQMAAEALGMHQATTSIVITCLWPLATLVVAWVIYKRISSDQPREIVAPFALAFAWVLVAPWVFAWYTALAWATLTLVPRNRMTRWLTIVTVILAVWLSGGGQGAPGR
jgi:Glycosyltransferase family 87